MNLATIGDLRRAGLPGTVAALLEQAVNGGEDEYAVVVTFLEAMLRGQGRSFRTRNGSRAIEKAWGRLQAPSSGARAIAEGLGNAGA
jgi:hypothetical protein